MAAIPAALRKADIARFAQRAAQLENVKPVVAYWCEYWILKQIISKGLEGEDEESTRYSSDLMDKLEKTKADLADNDAIFDDMAAQAYIEQFANETFQRADNAMKANKVTRQTADTFSAAAAFLEMCQIWASLEPEVTAKIKFAKYHALRIAKAIKAGEDPNLSNPVPEPSAELRTSPLSATDPEVQMLDPPLNATRIQGPLRQPSVIEIPDESEHFPEKLAQRSAPEYPSHPSRLPSHQHQSTGQDGAPLGMPSPQRLEEDYYQNPPAGDVSPIVSPIASQSGSIRGGYFPAISDANTAASVPSLPPPSRDESQYNENLSMHSSSKQPPGSEASHPETQSARDPRARWHSPAQGHTSGAPVRPPQTSSVPPHTSTSNQPSLPRIEEAKYVADEEAILKAQKHARWAISALNFEDVNTAIKELRGALETLGGT